MPFTKVNVEQEIEIQKANDPYFAKLWTERELTKEFIQKFITVRESQNISQTQLAQASGVKQSAIARMESMKAVPQIDTLIKLLVPMGYTLDIVPLRK